MNPDSDLDKIVWSTCNVNCGIPAQRIFQLARQIGTAKPAYITQGWGPQRHAAGEQSARAICMLAILTGNVGVRGGNSGDREGPFGIAFPGIPVGENPVKTSIPCFMWTKAIDDPSNLTELNGGLLGMVTMIRVFLLKTVPE